MESSTISKLHASRQKEDILKNSDVFYPVQTVAKISRRAISTYSTISPENSIEIHRCVKEFASLIASEAGIQSMLEHPSRNLLQGEDILAALTLLGYEDYAEILEIYLQKLRQGTTATATSFSDPKNQPQQAKGTVSGKKEKESKTKSSSGIALQSKKAKTTTLEV